MKDLKKNKITTYRTNFNNMNRLSEKLNFQIEENRRIKDRLNFTLRELEKYKNAEQEKMNADFTAFEIIENAKCDAMESMYVIDDIKSEISLIKSDIEMLRKDLNIGTLTISDRVDCFKFKLEFYIQRLDKIKADFYNENGID